jgi:hypothetical protein
MLDESIGCSQEKLYGANTRQGDADNFYKQGQLLPENFIEAAKSKGKADKIDLRMQKVRFGVTSQYA